MRDFETFMTMSLLISVRELMCENGVLLNICLPLPLFLPEHFAVHCCSEEPILFMTKTHIRLSELLSKEEKLQIIIMFKMHLLNPT